MSELDTSENAVLNVASDGTAHHQRHNLRSLFLFLFYFILLRVSLKTQFDLFNVKL